MTTVPACWPQRDMIGGIFLVAAVSWRTIVPAEESLHRTIIVLD